MIHCTIYLFRQSSICILLWYLAPVLVAAVILNIPKFLYLAGFLKWINQQVIIRFGIIYQVKYLQNMNVQKREDRIISFLFPSFYST